MCVVLWTSRSKFHVHVIAEKPATEVNGRLLIALITLSYLLAVSVLINVGLTVTVLRIKGKSSCVKGDGFSGCTYN